MRTPEVTPEQLEAIHSKLDEQVRSAIDRMLLKYHRVLGESPTVMTAAAFRTSQSVIEFEQTLSEDGRLYFRTGLDDMELVFGTLPKDR